MSFCKLVSNNKRDDRKLVPNKKQVQFKLVPKIQVYRNIADPKSHVEIVCAEQVVGVYESSGYDNCCQEKRAVSCEVR